MPASVTLLELPVQEDAPLSLLDVDPELAELIDPADRAAARRATLAPTVAVAEGPFRLDAVLRPGRQAFGALIVSGIVGREVRPAGQPALRLLGPGDVLLACGGDPEQERGSTWNAVAPVRLAVIDAGMLGAVRRWPEIVRWICGRLQDCHDTTLRHLWISHQPRVEDRVLGLFRLLAERWGRVTPRGIVVPVALTHAAVGRMVGARRSTVTLALGALAAEGQLHRDDDGSWILDPARQLVHAAAG